VKVRVLLRRSQRIRIIGNAVW